MAAPEEEEQEGEEEKQDEIPKDVIIKKRKMQFKYLLQPENQVKTMVSKELHASIQPNFVPGIAWLKMKSYGDNYNCHMIFNSNIKVTIENKRII